jgi:hypothetical protein
MPMVLPSLILSVIKMNRVPLLARMSQPWQTQYRARDAAVGKSEKCYVTHSAPASGASISNHARVDASGMILKLKLGGIQRQILDG